MKTKIFINLTNGLEALEKENIQADEVHFLRIQSTYCESNRWEQILQELDHNFLMWAALGYECIVFDYGSNHPVSKAIYMGLEWIRFVLNKVWLGKTIIPYMKEKQVFSMFEAEYRKLGKRTINKIEYYKKFILETEIRISGIEKTTTRDNETEYYEEIAKKYL